MGPWRDDVEHRDEATRPVRALALSESNWRVLTGRVDTEQALRPSAHAVFAASIVQRDVPGDDGFAVNLVGLTRAAVVREAEKHRCPDIARKDGMHDDTSHVRGVAVEGDVCHVDVPRERGPTEAKEQRITGNERGVADPVD